MAHPRPNVSLAALTTLELGGPARWLVEASGDEDVREAWNFARASHLPLVPVGGGSNVLVPDAGIAAVVLLMRTRGVSVRFEGSQVLLEVEAGESFDGLVERTVREGWQGLECLSGIPGLVGATPVQNVGAYGQEVADTLTSVEVFDTVTGTVRTLQHADCGFSYRDSVLKRTGRSVVLRVRFRLQRGGLPALRHGELSTALGGAPTDLGQVRESVLCLRRSKSMVLDAADPNRRSVGSFFTNPIVEASVAARVREQWPKAPAWPQADGRVKLAAGWLIENAGIAKGTTRGAVGVSTRHALALVHHGGGTTADLLALAAEVVAQVEARFGVRLEREAVLLGPAE